MDPHAAAEKLHITSDFPKPSVVPPYPQGIGSRTPLDTKIHGCSSVLYKMAFPFCKFPIVDQKYCFPSWLIESTDAKPKDMEGQLYIYWKGKSKYKLTSIVQPRVVQESAVLGFHTYVNLWTITLCIQLQYLHSVGTLGGKSSSLLPFFSKLLL